jgi:hypothetical protein
MIERFLYLFLELFRRPKLKGLHRSDPVLRVLLDSCKRDWKILMVILEDVKGGPPQEAKKWITLRCLAPDGQSYDYSYNYLKIKREL